MVVTEGGVGEHKCAFVRKFISVELVDIGILCILGVDENKYLQREEANIM